jgi:hypothetical protein
MDKVEFFCQDRADDREFYDYYQVKEKGVKPLTPGFREELDALRMESVDRLQEHRDNAEKRRRAGSPSTEAAELRQVSDLLWENMTPDMPFFNTEDCSYHLPRELDDWWAVLVTFH